VALSPDGKRLIAHGNHSRVWDVRTGKILVECEINRSGLLDRVGFSADGTAMALTGGSMEPRIYLLDPTATRQPFVVLSPPPANAIECDYTPDGTGLIAAGTDVLDGPVQLARYDVRTGKRVWEVRSESHMPPLVSTSRDGSVVALGAKMEIQFRVFDGKTGKERAVLKSSVWTYEKLCVSPDGTVVAAATAQEPDRNKHITMAPARPGGYPPPRRAVVELWDVAAKRIRHAIPRTVAPSAGGLAFSPDGKLLVFSESDHLTLVDVVTGKEIWRVPVAHNTAFQPAFSADGKTIALGQVGTVTLRDAKTGLLLPESGSSSVAVATVVFPAENRLVFGTEEFQAWDPVEVRPFERHPAVFPVHLSDDESNRAGPPVVLSADGSHSAAEDQPGRVSVFDIRTAKPVRTMSPGPCRFALAPDGKTLFTGTAKAMTAWDVKSGARRWEAAVDAAGPRESFGERHPRENIQLAVSPDGRSVALVERSHRAETGPSLGGSVQVWEAATGKEKLTGRQPAETWTTAVALSDDGRLAVGTMTQYATSSVRVWDVAAGKVTVTMEYKDTFHEPTCLAFSPDGRTIAHGTSRDGNYAAVRIWEVATGNVRVRYPYASNQYAAAFSPRGGSLAVASTDGPVLVWDVWGSRTEQFPEPDKAAAARAWDRLADADAVVAFASMKLLAAHPAVAVPLVRTHLSPVPTVAAKRVATLIDELDSPVFATREAASKELSAAADTVAGELKKAAAGATSAEQRQRLDRLLKSAGETSPDQLRRVRAVEVLERAGTDSAKRLLSDLATGAAAARMTKEATSALGRLAK